MPDPVRNQPADPSRRRVIIQGLSAGLGALFLPQRLPASGKFGGEPLLSAIDPFEMTDSALETDASMAISPLTIRIKLTAKAATADSLLKHLRRAQPAAQQYEGCHYSKLYRQAEEKRTVVLLQGWESRASQAAYIHWRQKQGELEQLLGLVSGNPMVDYWERLY